MFKKGFQALHWEMKAEQFQHMYLAVLHQRKPCLSAGTGQRPCPSVHLSPEDTPAMFGICRGEDLSE